MGTLILCKQPIAATPYYLEEASLNVYSLEELSYYMLNNVYLLNSQFMSVELCNWIGRDLKLNKLSVELLDLIQNSAPLHVFVGHILAACGYASNKEIKDLLSIISTFENKSEAERKKMRADRLMDRQRFVNAIYEYEALLKSNISKTMTKPMVGDVHHNLGCAYAKLFFFDEAIYHFEEAYKHNMKKSSLNCLLYGAKCKKDNYKFEELVRKYQVSPADVEDILSNISHLTSREEIISFDKKIYDFAVAEEGLNQNPNEISNIVDEWKDNYIKLCRI